MTADIAPVKRKPLVDGGKDLHIKLTPADPVGARRSDPSACIVARAIRRGKGVLDVRVGAEIVRIEYADKVVRYELSRNDRALVAGFDGGVDAFAAGYVVKLCPPPKRGRLSRGDTIRRGVQGSDRRSGKHDGVVRRRFSLRHIDVIPEHDES